jgi:hypothetical protein
LKSKFFILALFVLALASGVFFFKDEIFKPKQISAWSFVPKNAVSVWESSRTIEVWNRFVNTEHWENLSSIPTFRKINNDLIYLDSITGSNGNLDNMLLTGHFLISIHTISRNQFDNIFFLELTSQEYRDIALQLTNSFKNKANITYSERTYHDQLIIEIQDKSAKRTFSYFVRDNFFVASFTPFLIEDAIRTYKREVSNFKDENENAFELASLEFDAGNLYLNLKNLSSFAGLFFADSNEEFLQPFKHLNGSGFMDIDFDKNLIFGNGFLVANSDSSYLSVFNQQEPVTTGFSNFIPGNTAKLFYQSFTDVALWHQNVRNYWANENTVYTARLDSLSENLEFDLERMLSWMGSQLISMDLESVDGNPGKILLGESNDVYESLNQLNRITEKVNEANGDTLYFENYGEVTIRLLNLQEFPSAIFGEWYKGYPVTYYALIDPFVIMANDIEPIKELIDDRESENTWGQSISKSDFIKNSLDESNIGMVINTPKAWNHLQKRLAPYWQKGWTGYARNIKQIELASLQISKSTDKYYGSIVLKNRSGASRDISKAGARRVMNTSIGSQLIMKPKVTRNHRDGSWEILTLDSMNRLSLYDGRGTLLWQQFLDSPIRGKMFQVDYFKNKKLQYLIATDSLLHIIDRNGEFLEDFPKNIEDIDVDGLSVIDYDNSKNYRFMLAETGGDIYLLNKEGKRLEGWSPNSFAGRFSTYPFHMRVRGKDVFLGIKESGEVIATNRRGESLGGFPLDLDARIGGEVFYQVKSGFDRTIFTVVSEEGEIIQFNLEGKIRDRKQLYRPASDTRFTLVKESLGKSYLITRQDLNRLAILDKEGEMLFEKDFFADDPFKVQYYNFGAGQDMIVVSNAEPGKVLIYDDQGSLIVPQLDSDYPVSIVHYESRSLYHVYTATADSLFIHSIQE